MESAFASWLNLLLYCIFGAHWETKVIIGFILKTLKHPNLYQCSFSSRLSVRNNWSIQMVAATLLLQACYLKVVVADSQKLCMK